MRAGGGKQKGSGFERELCSKLSLWLTKGARADIFSRNVGSGSRFTVALKKGRELAHGGDLMPAHELAFAFMNRFLIEAKFYRDLQIAAYFFLRGKFLTDIIEKTAEQANAVNKDYLIIAKQNHMPPVVITNRKAGTIILASLFQLRSEELAMAHHVMYGRDFVCRFDDFLNFIDPALFLAALADRFPNDSNV